MMHFVRRDTATGHVVSYFAFGLDAGPVEFPQCPDGMEYVPVNVPFVRSPPTPHHEAVVLENGDIDWIDTAVIEQHRAEAIDAIDAAGEALRQAVINRMTTQTEEYRRVEAQARAWRETGYPEDQAPRGVVSWAKAKYRDGWTNRQAADDILATADGWYDILDDIRDRRLMNKENVRHEADAAEIRAIVDDMRADMLMLAEQLQLTITP